MQLRKLEDLTGHPLLDRDRHGVGRTEQGELQLEVFGALSGELLDRIEQGHLDVALVTRLPNRRRGKVLRRERLVWAGSRQHRAQVETPLPLALFPDGCVFREHALAALDAHGPPWRVA